MAPASARHAIMRSLFIRILLWFLIATSATSAIVVITSSWFGQPNLVNFYASGLLSAHLEEARAAYERDGREGLTRFVETFEHGFARDVHVTDASGRDLLTGEDIASRAAQSGRLDRGGLLAFGNRNILLTKSTADGRYRIFLPVGWVGDGPGLWRPQLAIGLLVVIALCWALARHLSRPVRDLQHVMERFGGGETGIRARSSRSDEIGGLARAFDAMADRIEELVHGQRRLLLDISHELRSPLARLTIATDLLRTDPRDAASLEQIELEADRLNQLIGEILQAARPDAPDSKRHFTAVSLDALVRDVVEACRIEAADGRVLNLVIDSDSDRESHRENDGGGEVRVLGDRELLRRAIENVLRNALRYAPPQTAVDVRVTPQAIITIRDRGPGVPDAALPHLFTPFYRVEPDRERRTGGVGLGLAIVRRAVELHGGRVSARNARPGLEVELLIPPASDWPPSAAPGTALRP
jgi:signal transduction histidine kinase